MRIPVLMVCLLAVFALPARAGSDDPRAWIARMNAALASRNYDGVFIHQVGDKRETLRIIHCVRDGRMTERLVSTDGSGREFVRDGSEWKAYFPDRKIVVVEQRGRSSGFITALNDLSAEAERFYDIRGAGQRTRLQGISTRLISVAPRDGLRYGYRFWIDEKTGMPVKTQLVTANGVIIEEISFVSISLLTKVDDELLKPDVDTAGFKWLRRDTPGSEGSVKVAFVPHVDLLPQGFHVKASSGASTAPNTGPRARFIISDGIAWVSVFIESAGGAKGAGGDGRRATGATQMGPSAAYTTNVADHSITVVGEVPPVTVKAIAEAVLPE
jgi:sigma-E factor negative regulatory protein RseB